MNEQQVIAQGYELKEPVYAVGNPEQTEPNRVVINYADKFAKSIVTLGNIDFYNTKKFNCLNKLLLKFFFGMEIKNLNDKEKV